MKKEMGKSSSKARPAVVERWDAENYLVRYNIEEVADMDADGKEQGVKYEYEEVLVPEVTRKRIVEALVRLKYDIYDEVTLAFDRENNAEDKAAHEAYVIECKAIADSVLGNE